MSFNRQFTCDLTSFQDAGGDTGDPGKEGGPAERKGEPAEKAGGERRPEEAEQRGEQVSCGIVLCSSRLRFKSILCRNRKKSLKGMKRKHEEEEEDSEVEDPGLQEGQEAAVESDDEVEYYRQAVGQEPDEGEHEDKRSPQSYCWTRLVTINLFLCADMFPSAKRRKGPSPGRPARKERTGKSPKQTAPGGQEPRDNAGKGWKKSRDGDKPFNKKKTFGGKTFGGKKAGDREKKFDGNKKDKSFKSKVLKAKAGFRKKGTGAKQGFKHKKGKG